MRSALAHAPCAALRSPRRSRPPPGSRRPVGSGSRRSRPAAEPARPARVLSLDVKAPITSGTAEYVEAGLARAQAEGFDAVAITLDTPGGHLDATRDIVQHMLASDVPIVVWVGPAGARAGSAGVFITLAADVAAMHPTSNIGAAHPVLGGGEDVEKQAGKDMAQEDGERHRRLRPQHRHGPRPQRRTGPRRRCGRACRSPPRRRTKLQVIDVVAPDLPSALAFADGRTAATHGRRAGSIHARDATVEPARDDRPPADAGLPLRPQRHRPPHDARHAGDRARVLPPGRHRPGRAGRLLPPARLPLHEGHPGERGRGRAASWPAWRCSSSRRTSPRTASPALAGAVLLADRDALLHRQELARVPLRPGASSRSRPGWSGRRPSRSRRCWASWAGRWPARAARSSRLGAPGMIGEVGEALARRRPGRRRGLRPRRVLGGAGDAAHRPGARGRGSARCDGLVLHGRGRRRAARGITAE